MNKFVIFYNRKSLHLNENEMGDGWNLYKCKSTLIYLQCQNLFSLSETNPKSWG